VADQPDGGACGEVDAGSAAGLECVQTQADAMLAKVRRKFKEYGINEKPFVVVKADAGGMGPAC
jgi:glutamate--cysteine ligase